MRDSDLYWQSYLNIEDEIISLSKLVLFTDGSVKVDSDPTSFDLPDQMSVCSNYIADLIVRCATQIESLMKTIYSKLRNDYGLPSTFSSEKYKKDPTYLSFNSTCYELVNYAFHLEDNVVYVSQSLFDFKKEENINLKPLSHESFRREGGWGVIYQDLKHYRVQSLIYGNIRNLIEACAALYLLNIYLKYYDEPAIYSTRSGYNNQSFSFGSRIFSLAKPKIAADLETKNNPEKTPESPFIARFNDKDFNSIQNKYVECENKSLDFFMHLREFNSPEFNAYFADLKNKNPKNKYIYTVELIKYRLKKRINEGTTFEERKKLLITSEEWKQLKKSNNPSLNANDVTIDTMDEIIDRIGYIYVSSVEANLSITPFMNYTTTKKIELVISLDITGWDKNK